MRQPWNYYDQADKLVKAVLDNDLDGVVKWMMAFEIEVRMNTFDEINELRFMDEVTKIV